MLKISLLNKRGFAIQFNWLFVLIGGVVILSFFVSLINNSTFGNDQETDQKSTEEVNALLKVSLASGNTQKTMSFDKKIMFYCDDTSEFFVGAAFKPARYDYNAIFSPKVLDSSELIIQTLALNIPFRAMPLVYVTNKDIEYVFVGNAPLINLVFNQMPDNVTMKSIPAGSIAYYPNFDFDHTVFILSDTSHLAALSNFAGTKDVVYAVVLEPGSANVYSYGNISFYRYDTPSSSFVLDGTLPFLGSELLLGGVISHDKTIYECNLKKVITRISTLSKLHEERMVYYGDNAESHCQMYYAGSATSAINYLEDLKIFAEKNELSVVNFQSIYSAISSLRSLNNFIITKTECPRIY
ncbi:MAG: hypothetical protein KKE98_05300 [Nanoarchaeota archaeon]|nr:hypothetical protein [Nanoarchaeota archaeon]MBU1597834.1 hypothetical protein [Nanoarchaeota archaeon]